MNGRLIVFEGVEGSGKTTQLQRCHKWLDSEAQSLLQLFRRGMPVESNPGNTPSDYTSLLNSEPPTQLALESAPISVIVTNEPGGTELGLGLRKLLLGEAEKKPIQDKAELLLYAADRAQHVEEVLKPQLARTSIILCDRYTDSTIAYQGFGRGMSIEMIEQINRLATGGLQSDLTILLDIDPEISLKRILTRRKLDRIEKTDLAFHQRVRSGYLTLAKKYPDRIVVVDAAQSADKVALDIQDILQKFMKL